MSTAYASPVVIGQSVKIRTSSGLGIPSGFKGQIANVSAVQNLAPVVPQSADNMDEILYLLTGTTQHAPMSAETPVRVKLADGTFRWFLRGQLSTESSKLS
jgi:hypothetical protein